MARITRGERLARNPYDRGFAENWSIAKIIRSVHFPVKKASFLAFSLCCNAAISSLLMLYDPTT
ncbi:hypothetical protein M433DRAFT_419346 [Acidomyces richmondensis BFW]|nr:hypothetical protein M433DRAFT_419346 [Acidomyces richmondensis BFW]